MIKNFIYIIYFPFFIFDLLRHKIFKTQNFKFSHLFLIKMFCLTGGWSNKLINFFLKTKLDKSDSTIEKNNFIKKDLKYLNENGFLVKKNFLKKKELNKIYNHIISKKGFYNFSNNTKRVKVNLLKPESSMFINDADELIKSFEIQNLIVNDYILKIAEGYFKSKPIIDHCNSWWSFKNLNPNKSSAQLWHFDLDRTKWLKIFFYITDCGPKNGPHSFIKKTHLNNSIPYNLRKDGYRRIFDEEIKNYFKENDIAKITGLRGTMIIEDTQGLHKGEMVLKGKRLILQIQLSTALFGTDEFKKIRLPQKKTKKFSRSLNRNKHLFLNFLD